MIKIGIECSFSQIQKCIISTHEKGSLITNCIFRFSDLKLNYFYFE